MKLGILIPEFPGQTHSFFWREINILKRHYGADVTIFSTRVPKLPVHHDWTDEAEAVYLHPPPRRVLPLVALKAVVGGIKLALSPKDRAVLSSARSLAMVLPAAYLADLCRRAGIDHVHVHSCGNAALIAALAHRMGGADYSLTLHGALRDYGDHQPYKWENAKHVFTVSETLKKDVSDVIPSVADRIRIAPMGVDTDRFRPAPETSGNEGSFRWLVCARLNPGKGYETLLDAMEQLDPEINYTIRVAGEDDEGGSGYRKALEHEIAARQLSGRITLLGALPQERILEELQAADGFVLPSLHEALGVAYMEAMACGLPVIGSRTGGVPELIEDGVSGLLVEPKDDSTLADAMERVMKDADLRGRLAAAGRETVVSRFNARRSADELAMALSLKEHHH